MKTNFKMISGVVATFLLAGTMATTLFVSSCSKDDSVEPLTGTNNTGTDVINTLPGGTWSLDKTHSNVMWETFYFGSNALLTGRFNNFGISIDMKQANLANSSIKAWVQLSTFNTGEPGRDGYGKCGPGYMGVVWDTVSAGPPVVLAPNPNSDTAWFNSTNIVKYGTGYKALGTLNFRGVTKNVNLFFTYSGISEYTTTTPPSYKCGFIGEFTIKAVSDFGVTSTSIDDEVKIRIDANCKKL